jgi:uncharacterized alkaline shock family protein YloU
MENFMSGLMKSHREPKKFDTKELELPETTFIRDIEDRVFQSLVLQVLAEIEGISLIEGNFLDYILGRSAVDGVKGIYAEQDSKKQSLNIKVEVNVRYGISIPLKAEEIQTKIVESLTEITGLHVSGVHVVFKNVISQERMKKLAQQSSHPIQNPTSSIEEEFGEEF